MESAYPEREFFLLPESTLSVLIYLTPSQHLCFLGTKKKYAYSVGITYQEGFTMLINFFFLCQGYSVLAWSVFLIEEIQK